tara:strand:+ start:589 stop:804 length:216 start_codon:yes stop_codon:yes gene_type:complete
MNTKEGFTPNRTEYDLIFQAFKNYRVYMTDEQEVISEQILDKLFYPSFDSLDNDVSPCEGVEDTVKLFKIK